MRTRFKVPAISFGAVVLVAATALAFASPAVATASRPASKPMTRDANGLALAQARAFLSHVNLGAPLHRVGVTHGVVTDGITQLQSTNWSGYADTGAANSISQVSGSWVEPTATCTSAESLAAFWVGIDGISASDPTVQQDGTIIECLSGTAHYYDWWENYPANPVEVVSSVSPGDAITAQVIHNGQYSMSVTDSTHSADSFTVNEPCGASTCENESAEWIAEAPCCKGSSVYPLSNFKVWKLTGAQTTYLGTPGSITVDPSTDEITMVDSGNAVKAAPGPLKLSGTKFKDTWKKSN
jgi:hypothetical protein